MWVGNSGTGTRYGPSNTGLLRISVGVAAATATAAPLLFAHRYGPSPTIVNQHVAVLLWGLATVAFAFQNTSKAHTVTTPTSAPEAGPWGRAALTAATLLAFAATVPDWISGTSSVAFSAAATLLTASLMAWLGARSADPKPRDAQVRNALFATNARPLPEGLLIGWFVAGAASAGIALLQVFAPQLLASTDLIVRSELVGRAVGNVRQPNHLATLLLGAAIAVIPLAQRYGAFRPAALPCFALMVFALVLSGSRTGLVGLVVLTLWAIIDARLARSLRLMLGAGLPLYAVFWLGMAWWARASGAAFGAAEQFTGADISSSRFAIWHNTIDLIAQHPWTGVGWGHFNLAWSLTPFPNRPTAFFDHTHNIMLQLMVELGLPFGLLVSLLLAVALWQAGRRAWQARGESAVVVRALFMMVLMMAIHSQLEYPLWYAYFLLPTALAWGACLVWPRDDSLTLQASAGPARHSSPWLMTAGLLMVAGSVYAFVDYLRISTIFASTPQASPLEGRIAAGRRSLFFAHQADYAHATTVQRPGDAMDSINVAKLNLLDTRLMIAWAQAHAERGNLDHARHIAERLREFKNPASRPFFAVCIDAPPPRPYQCDPSSGTLTWKDFLDRP